MEEKEFDNFDDVKAEETIEETEEVLEETETEELGEEERKAEEIEEKEEEPDKFKGKSREEIIQSYRELEKLNSKKENPIKREDRVTSKEQKERLDKLREEIEKMDFSKMDPKTYTNWLFEKNREIMEAETILREKVRKEVLEVYKEFPQLQLDKNEELRGLVLAIVNDYKSRGETIGIREAVAKVNKMIEGFKGKEEPKEEKKEVKKPKAIEKTEPVTTGKGEDTEEDRVKRGILNAGSRAGMLGGL